MLRKICPSWCMFYYWNEKKCQCFIQVSKNIIYLDKKYIYVKSGVKQLFEQSFRRKIILYWMKHNWECFCKRYKNKKTKQNKKISSIQDKRIQWNSL